MSTETAASQAEHLQSDMINELKELLGVEKFKYLVDVFSETSNKNIQILHDNDEIDFEALYAAAHSMAGSSANMGALVLTELCRQLEKQAKESNSEHIKTIIQGIVAEQALVVTELGRLCE